MTSVHGTYLSPYLGQNHSNKSKHLHTFDSSPSVRDNHGVKKQKQPKELQVSHPPLAEEGVWSWPLDDQTPVDITPYYVSKYRKSGLSYWVGAARRIGPTMEDWEQRRKAPIQYLLKDRCCCL